MGLSKARSDKSWLKNIEGKRYFAMTHKGKTNDTPAMAAARLIGGDFTAV